MAKEMTSVRLTRFFNICRIKIHKPFHGTIKNS